MATGVKPGEKVENRNTDRRYPYDDVFKPEYPLNRSMITPGGHEVHFDDTPGHRRIRIAHVSGTNIEIANDGRMTFKVVGNEHKYNKQGVTETIDGHYDTKVHGHARMSYGRGVHIEVHGETDIVLNGSNNSIVSTGNLRLGAKNIDIVAENTINMLGESVNVDALQGGGGMVTIRGPGVRTRSYNDTIIQADKNLWVESGQNTRMAADKMTIEVNNYDLAAAIGILTKSGSSGTLLLSSSYVLTKGKRTLLQGGGIVVPPLTVVG
jgi:hypothetical protein